MRYIPRAEKRVDSGEMFGDSARRFRLHFHARIRSLSPDIHCCYVDISAFQT
jgi:hypothetical protein